MKYLNLLFHSEKKFKQDIGKHLYCRVNLHQLNKIISYYYITDILYRISFNYQHHHQLEIQPII